MASAATVPFDLEAKSITLGENSYKIISKNMLCTPIRHSKASQQSVHQHQAVCDSLVHIINQALCDILKY